jgi:putative transposase
MLLLRSARHCCCLTGRGASAQLRSKSLLWYGTGLSSCHLGPFLIPPLAPTSDREPFLRLLPPRFPRSSQSSLWKFRPHRVAISNNRLLNIEDGQVQFRYKDYRDGSQQKTMTLSADKFIRRFLLHVLPERFQRIRYYGFLGNRYRKEELERCRQLLGMAPPEEPPSAEKPLEDYRDRYEALTGSSLWECPACHRGRMIIIGEIPPGVTPTIIDTS